jgi:hypothetical protein
VSDRNIFENVQMFESAPSALLYPEEAPYEYLESLVFDLIEPNPPNRNFVPWYVYQAKEYLQYAIDKRVENIKKKYCE